jgi:hypothetical protein
VWTATGQSVSYENWDDGQPQFNEGEGHTIYMESNEAKMTVSGTSLNAAYYVGHYICEKNTSVNGLRNSQMKQKSCSAGSDWTCHNEVTGCYCHQTIEVSSSLFLFDNLRINLFHPIDRGIGRMPPHSANPLT